MYYECWDCFGRVVFTSKYHTEDVHRQAALNAFVHYPNIRYVVFDPEGKKELIAERIDFVR